jgi:hypothetical protein
MVGASLSFPPGCIFAYQLAGAGPISDESINWLTLLDYGTVVDYLSKTWKDYNSVGNSYRASTNIAIAKTTPWWMHAKVMFDSLPGEGVSQVITTINNQTNSWRALVILNKLSGVNRIGLGSGGTGVYGNYTCNTSGGITYIDVVNDGTNLTLYVDLNNLATTAISIDGTPGDMWLIGAYSGLANPCDAKATKWFIKTGLAPTLQQLKLRYGMMQGKLV